MIVQTGTPLTVADRVTPVRRGPTPPPPYDPRTAAPTAWASSTAGTLYDSRTARPTLTPEQRATRDLAAQVEADGILHRADMAYYDDYIVRQTEAANRYVDTSSVDTSGLPDPWALLGRRFREEGQRSRASLRNPETRKQRREEATALLASARLSDVQKWDPLLNQLNTAYWLGRIPRREWRNRVTLRISQLRDRSRTRAANGRR